MLFLFPADRLSFEGNCSGSIEYGRKEEIVLLGCFPFNGQCDIDRFARIIGSVLLFNVQCKRMFLLWSRTIVVVAFAACSAGYKQQEKKNLFHGAKI